MSFKVWKNSFEPFKPKKHNFTLLDLVIVTLKENIPARRIERINQGHLILGAK